MIIMIVWLLLNLKIDFCFFIIHSLNLKMNEYEEISDILFDNKDNINDYDYLRLYNLIKKIKDNSTVNYYDYYYKIHNILLITNIILLLMTIKINKIHK